MNGKLEYIIGGMTEIALKKIKHYFTDFTKYDLPQIVEAKQGRYLWLVRDTGTWLIDINNNICIDDFLLYQIGSSNSAYDININEVYIEEIKCDIDSIRKYYNL